MLGHPACPVVKVLAQRSPVAVRKPFLVGEAELVTDPPDSHGLRREAREAGGPEPRATVMRRLMNHLLLGRKPAARASSSVAKHTSGSVRS